MRVALVSCAVCLTLHFPGAVSAQEVQSPAFDVASVKQNRSRDSASRVIWPRGRLSALSVSARDFIEIAYGLQSFQLEGGPSWIASDHFDIEAKYSGEIKPAERGMPETIQRMMRQLLAERFGLTTHAEKRRQTIYRLTAAKRGLLGPRLRKSMVNCKALMAEVSRGGPLPSVSSDGRPTCGFRGGAGKVMVGGLPLSQLAVYLTGHLRTKVEDRTGLDGDYDFDLIWTPDGPRPTDDSSIQGAEPQLPADLGPSIFTAVQEQLGLKLQATTGPVDVQVIDTIHKPTND